jgi:hypothetical protein
VEEQALLARREVGGNCLERVENLIERGVQAGNRKVAGEHRPAGTEAVDAVADDHAEAVERPVMIVGNEIGNLDVDVRADWQALAAPPATAPYRRRRVRSDCRNE